MFWLERESSFSESKNAKKFCCRANKKFFNAAKSKQLITIQAWVLFGHDPTTRDYVRVGGGSCSTMCWSESVETFELSNP